ncbi:unnamed protein product, partial [Sphagnum jensenii]
MNGKSQDRKAIKHWCAKDEATKNKEKALAERIAQAQREHEARQTSGSYVAISAEEAASACEIAAVYEQTVGVVGTRQPTSYGRGLAKELARGLAQS